MKRGSIVVARARGDFTAKARPYVVVQNDAATTVAAAVTLCPLTSMLTGRNLVRVRIEPDASNGLKVPSEVAVDLITTMRKSRIESVVGDASAAAMKQIDSALKRWLAL